MGRVVLNPNIYFPEEAFRFSHATLRPGEVTARNAVPWQADFHQCRWEGGGKNLGWWPAQRPDDVLKDPNANPVEWARGLKDTGESMARHWHRLGFVKRVSQNPDVFLEQDRDPTLQENGAV
jgi:hypothetical protein